MKRRFFAVLAVCLCCCALSACGKSSSSRAAAGVPRVDAGYTHWLEQRSILGQAERTLQQSGGWSASAPVPAKGAVAASGGHGLEGSAMRLVVQPQNLATMSERGFLSELLDPEFTLLIKQLGFTGLYLDAAHGSGSAWQPRRAAIEADTDAVTSGLAEDWGDPRGWTQLMTTLKGQQMELGLTLLPPFTGAGPDFLLALQNARQWPLAYGLMNVPRDQWGLLPAMPPAEDNTPPTLMPLSEEKLVELRRAGLVPTFDAAAGAQSPVRWAVTSEAKGYDGVTRRWIYRMLDTPWRPVLRWNDPAATSRRMLTGATLDNLAQLRPAVVGLRLKAAQLPEAPETVATIIRDMGSLAHEHGARVEQRDPLPLDSIPQQQAAGADLVFDSVTAPAVEYAVLSGDAGPLRAALARSLELGVDHSRLIRPLTLLDGVDFAAAGLPASVLDPYKDAWADNVPMHGGKIQATLPTLAAMRAGLAPSPAIMAAVGESRDKVRPIHELVLLFRGGLPGLLEVTGQDLTGVLYSPLSLKEYPELLQNAPVTLPAWGPGNRVSPANRRGVAAGVMLYEPIMRQYAGATDSFISSLNRLTQIRQQTGVAQGKIVDLPATTNPGTVAVLTRLPDGSHLLVVANFTAQTLGESISFPPQASQAKQDLWSGASISPGTVSLKLPPFSCRLLHVSGGGSAQTPKESS